MTPAQSDDPAHTERLAIIERVVASPPLIHPKAPLGVWATLPECYEFMAAQVHKGARTLETGAGISTVLFAAWGCEHTCVVPIASQRDGLYAYCGEAGIDTSRLTIDVRRSEEALPLLAGDGELDLVLVDGNHSFPIPIIDWFYGAGRLRAGGIVIFDDLPLVQVSHFLSWYLDRDPRWERIVHTREWAAYRRLSEGPPSDLWHGEQPFLVDVPAPWDKMLGRARRAFDRARRAVSPARH